MKPSKSFILLPFMVLFLNCTTDSESDLVNIPTDDPVSYSGTVKNIIDTNCIMCHGTTPTNYAPMSLTTYENVKDAVLTRGLLDRISRPQGSSGMMPFGGTRLPQSSINQIESWKNNGFIE